VKDRFYEELERVFGKFPFLLFAKYNWNYQIEEDEVGEACGANGGEEEHV
jgi:hypothetical protein